MCLLNESLLSRTTPRYLSDCMSSWCVKAAVGGSIIKMSAADSILCSTGDSEDFVFLDIKFHLPCCCPFLESEYIVLE